jgi:hypothetical protein
MTTVVSRETKSPRSIEGTTSRRAEALAERLERGAAALAALAGGLSDNEWQTRLPKDGRKIGVVIHHVASAYPVEMHLAQVLAEGKPIEGVTMDNIHEMNAAHAKENDSATKESTINLLRQNSAAAAAAIRLLTDEDLDRAAPASLYGGAPITCQFLLEDHPVRHSYHHLARIKAALNR